MRLQAPVPSLLADLARGGSDARRRVVDVFGPVVWSIARTYCRDQHAAEDAAQEAFLRLCRVAHRYDPSRGTEAAFVAAVARSSVIDFRRQAAPAAPPIADTATAPDAPPFADDARRAVEILGTLPTEQQEAVRLAVQRGMTQEEIAGALRLPLGTVKTRIRSALMRMREALGAPRTTGRARSEAIP